MVLHVFSIEMVKYLLSVIISSLFSGLGFVAITMAIEYAKAYRRDQREKQELMRRRLNSRIEWSPGHALIYPRYFQHRERLTLQSQFAIEGRDIMGRGRSQFIGTSYLFSAYKTSPVFLCNTERKKSTMYEIEDESWQVRNDTIYSGDSALKRKPESLNETVSGKPCQVSYANGDSHEFSSGDGIFEFFLNKLEQRQKRMKHSGFRKCNRSPERKSYQNINSTQTHCKTCELQQSHKINLWTPKYEENPTKTINIDSLPMFTSCDKCRKVSSAKSQTKSPTKPKLGNDNDSTKRKSRSVSLIWRNNVDKKKGIGLRQDSLSPKSQKILDALNDSTKNPITTQCSKETNPVKENETVKPVVLENENTKPKSKKKHTKYQDDECARILQNGDTSTNIREDSIVSISRMVQTKHEDDAGNQDQSKTSKSSKTAETNTLSLTPITTDANRIKSTRKEGSRKTGENESTKSKPHQKTNTTRENIVAKSNQAAEINNEFAASIQQADGSSNVSTNDISAPNEDGKLKNEYLDDYNDTGYVDSMRIIQSDDMIDPMSVFSDLLHSVFQSDGKTNASNISSTHIPLHRETSNRQSPSFMLKQEKKSNITLYKKCFDKKFNMEKDKKEKTDDNDNDGDDSGEKISNQNLQLSLEKPSFSSTNLPSNQNDDISYGVENNAEFGIHMTVVERNTICMDEIPTFHRTRTSTSSKGSKTSLRSCLSNERWKQNRLAVRQNSSIVEHSSADSGEEQVKMIKSRGSKDNILTSENSLAVGSNFDKSLHPEKPMSIQQKMQSIDKQEKQVCCKKPPRDKRSPIRGKRTKLCKKTSPARSSLIQRKKKLPSQDKESPIQYKESPIIKKMPPNRVKKTSPTRHNHSPVRENDPQGSKEKSSVGQNKSPIKKERPLRSASKSPIKKEMSSRSASKSPIKKEMSSRSASKSTIHKIPTLTRKKSSPIRNTDLTVRAKVSPGRVHLSLVRQNSSLVRKKLLPRSARKSPIRQNGSPNREKMSPGLKKKSPLLKNDSLIKKKTSPIRGVISPLRQNSSLVRKITSPRSARKSPIRRNGSPNRDKMSPGPEKKSTFVKNKSLYRKKPSPIGATVPLAHQNNSQVQKKTSPTRQNRSPTRKKWSPSLRKILPISHSKASIHNETISKSYNDHSITIKPTVNHEERNETGNDKMLKKAITSKPMFKGGKPFRSDYGTGFKNLSLKTNLSTNDKVNSSNKFLSDMKESSIVVNTSEKPVLQSVNNATLQISPQKDQTDKSKSLDKTKNGLSKVGKAAYKIKQPLKYNIVKSFKKRNIIKGNNVSDDNDQNNEQKETHEKQDRINSNKCMITPAHKTSTKDSSNFLFKKQHHKAVERKEKHSNNETKNQSNGASSTLQGKELNQKVDLIKASKISIISVPDEGKRIQIESKPKEITLKMESPKTMPGKPMMRSLNSKTRPEAKHQQSIESNDLKQQLSTRVKEIMEEKEINPLKEHSLSASKPETMKILGLSLPLNHINSDIGEKGKSISSIHRIEENKRETPIVKQLMSNTLPSREDCKIKNLLSTECKNNPYNIFSNEKHLGIHLPDFEEKNTLPNLQVMSIVDATKKNSSNLNLTEETAKLDVLSKNGGKECDVPLQSSKPLGNGEAGFCLRKSALDNVVKTMKDECRCSPFHKPHKLEINPLQPKDDSLNTLPLSGAQTYTNMTNSTASNQPFIFGSKDPFNFGSKSKSNLSCDDLTIKNSTNTLFTPLTEGNNSDAPKVFSNEFNFNPKLLCTNNMENKGQQGDGNMLGNFEALPTTESSIFNKREQLVDTVGKGCEQFPSYSLPNKIVSKTCSSNIPVSSANIASEGKYLIQCCQCDESFDNRIDKVPALFSNPMTSANPGKKDFKTISNFPSFGDKASFQFNSLGQSYAKNEETQSSNLTNSLSSSTKSMMGCKNYYSKLPVFGGSATFQSSNFVPNQEVNLFHGNSEYELVNDADKFSRSNPAATSSILENKATKSTTISSLPIFGSNASFHMSNFGESQEAPLFGIGMNTFDTLPKTRAFGTYRERCENEN